MKKLSEAQQHDLQVIENLFNRVQYKPFERRDHEDLFIGSSIRNILAAALKPEYGSLMYRDGKRNFFKHPFDARKIIDAWIFDAKKQRSENYNVQKKIKATDLFQPMTDDQMIDRFKSK